MTTPTNHPPAAPVAVNASQSTTRNPAPATLSLVIPAFNEEKAIRDTIVTAQRVLAAAGLAPVEIIVVDDGSSDQTAAEAEQAGARVLRHPHNVGYGHSLKTGILAAQYDTVAISDADGTYPLERLPDLVHEFHQGFDLVVGARQGEHYDESMQKRLLRKILRSLVEFVTGTRIPDINSGLRVFSRRQIVPHFDSLCDTFSFTTSMTLIYLMTGKFVRHVPIEYRQRVGRTKVVIARDALRTLQFIVETITCYNPVKLFLVLCLPAVAVAAVSFLLALFLRPLVMCLLGMAASLLVVLLLALALLAIMLRQVLRALNSRSG